MSHPAPNERGCQLRRPLALIHNFLDNELGQLDHKLSQLGIFFTQCLCIGVFAIRLSRARRKRILGTGWQVRTSSKQMSILTEYFPNPLLSFIGTNQIRDCAAYPRPAQNRVHKIKLATAFVFGVDVGARRFRLGTLQILPNHGKSILAPDGMKLKSRIPARPHGRALRGGCGATSLAVPTTIPFALFA